MASPRRLPQTDPIRYAVAPCSLGWVLAAATANGLCAIEFDDQSEAVLARLQARFPQRPLHATADLDGWLPAVVALVDQPTTSLDLPLDIQGTAFQQRVWASLQRIPPGETRSYAALATELGQPTATRAVATACAANALAIVIPCHRVVRSDGALSGYRWGVARKQALLDREATLRQHATFDAAPTSEPVTA